MLSASVGHVGVDSLRYLHLTTTIKAISAVQHLLLFLSLMRNILFIKYEIKLV